ncbi:carbamate kinase [Actinobacteria bacterium YIM 96077]|uniref:Carbamate kinase n=1 Tax=Phytoactinopolyspora halophila TaxID=1981511 RepID=A0A329QND2_9ACTN|nr:carbamate kinase [Phytoactinopolyspora halophila]AYY12965.1 carbamate kinase [Actinobacteria bacterium YIM 96077]RAW13229.1 carbamate kinase [Phytoactinopolyspora halophila]
MRVLIALGGNAMTSPEGHARPEDQITAITQAMEPVADLIASGVDVVLTHGNGPQVGNLLVKNELAASVVPPVTLDWCGAQTQGTIGFVTVNALQRALHGRGIDRQAAAVVTRARVDADDPGLANPTKPIGRYLPRDEAQVLIEHGQVWEDRGERGWRRMVASPEPREILDAPAVSALIRAGFVVVANGGGGIPVVRDPDGTVRGVEAVIDKDLGAALLARMLDVDTLVIATDVDGAVLDYGTPRERALGLVDVPTMRKHAAEGHFAGGSMGPKVEACCRFVENGGRRAVITSLGRIADAVSDDVGTTVVPAA